MFVFFVKEEQVVKVERKWNFKEIHELMEYLEKASSPVGAILADNKDQCQVWDKYAYMIVDLHKNSKDNSIKDKLEKNIRVFEKCSVEACKYQGTKYLIPNSVKGYGQAMGIVNKALESTIEDLEKEVKEASQFLNKEEVKEILKADDDKAYALLLKKLEQGHADLKEWFGDTDMSRAIMKQTDKLKAKVNSFKENHKVVGDFITIIGKIVKKVVALAFNIVGFAIDTSICVVGLGARLLVATAEEVAETGKTICKIFKGRFL